jgi:hypothetical protein
MARQVVRVGEEKQRKKEGKRRIEERGKDCKVGSPVGLL